MNKSLGLIETEGLAAGIEAADAAVKSANVELIGYELTKGGGWTTVKIQGDVGAVKAAVDAAGQNGSQVYAVTFDSRLHPSCDLKIARQVAGELGGIHQVIRVDELEQEEIRSNPVNRCYLCKRHLFRFLRDFASARGIEVILDGTNEDDMYVYRPGIQALKELGIAKEQMIVYRYKSDDYYEMLEDDFFAYELQERKLKMQLF